MSFNLNYEITFIIFFLFFSIFVKYVFVYSALRFFISNGLNKKSLLNVYVELKIKLIYL